MGREVGVGGWERERGGGGRVGVGERGEGGSGGEVRMGEGACEREREQGVRV